ncbi:MAG: glycosyltransferase, partial [Saprospiraceae bacterium]
MISIITCSRAKDISTELRKNIVQTIGIEHEIIVFDNSANKHSIFQAYNIGASRAKYEILCFVHDDLFYMTQDWG